MEYGVLGPLRVRGPHGPVELRGLRERLLLALLLAADGRPVAASALIDGLWGEAPPASAPKSLQNVVLRLRRALEPERNGTPVHVLTEAGGYRLAVDRTRVDAWRFEEGLRSARQGAVDERTTAIRAALGLWRGDAYAGLDRIPSVASEARRLEELRAGALEECVAADLAVGAPSAVAELEALVGRYPTRERLWALLMTGLYRQGRQGDALAAYDRARTVLADDLGIDPGPELRALHARVLAQDDSLAAVRRRAEAAVEAAVLDVDAAVSTLGRAREEMTGRVLDLGALAREEADPDHCPWPGLAAYSADDGPWFAGRERLVAQLAARLTGVRCLAVVGASGSGKSSVVQAGLLAGLADGLLPGSAGWTLLSMRPGAHPVGELARVVLGVRRPDLGEVLERLVRSEGDAPADRTVLVVDQLEEVWTLCEEETERETFLDALTGLVADPASPVELVLVVRADFLDRLAHHAALATAVGDSTVLVGTPTPDDVRRAVVTPARRGGLELDDGLVDAIVGDAGTEPGLLPLLSTSLRRLWERREGSRLTLREYVATDGLRGAIAHLAETEFARLDQAGQRDARLLLLRLAGEGDGDEVTRRRVRRDELAALPRDPAPVIERLAAARLLTVSDDHVEVAHEALFREWPRLRAWLDDDRAGRALGRRLAGATAEWRAADEDPALLWRGARLDAALEVVATRPDEVTRDESAFLDAARDRAESEERDAQARAEHQSRQNRRLRTLLAAALVLLLAGVAAGAVALRARDREASAADRAERSATRADAKRLAASALTVERADLALLTAVEATRLDPDPETYGAVLTLLARQPDVLARLRAGQRFSTVAASPDGGTVFLGESEPVLRAVDAMTGAEKWVRDDLPGMVGGLAASPDGGVLAAVLLALTPGDRDALVLLDARDGRELHRVELAEVNSSTGVEAPYLWTGVGWSARGDVVVGSDGGATVVGADGRVGRSVPWGRPVLDNGTFVVWPDGRASTGVSEAGPGVLVDTRRPGVPPRRLEETVWAVRPDSGRVAATRATTSGTELVLLDAATLRPRTPRWPLPGEVGVLRWSADGARLLVGIGEQVEVRDGRTGAPLTHLAGHNGGVASGAFVGPDGDLAWTAGRDGTAVGFDLTGRRGVITTRRTRDAPWAGEGAAAADLAVFTDRSDTRLNRAHLLPDGAGPGRRLPLTGLTDCACEATSTDLTPDGATALGGYRVLTDDFAEVPDAGHVVVWDTAAREVRGVVDTPWPVYAVDSGPDGRAVVLGGAGWGVLDLATLELTRSDDLDPWVRSGTGTSLVEVAPDGERAALLVGGDVLLVDLTDGSVLARQAVEAAPGGFAQSAAWASDGASIAVGTTNGWLHALDGDTLAPLAPRRQVTSGVLTDVEVSPDGGMAATLGPEGDVTLWDPASWSPYGQALFDDRVPGFLRFSPDSDRLLARFSDGTESEVAADPAVWVDAACGAANREMTADEWALARPGASSRPTCDRDATDG
ncbi:MAG TPA: BTAD domain-containing putative transcriptional regulator [Nocardioides sp.]|nr:BTAD domain-containing putative transcriptional regulator [Nocardioides sp.]